MFDVFLTGPFVPFTFALALLFGLLALELVMLLIGGSLLGLDADANLDLDAGDLDLDAGDVDIDADQGTGSVGGPAAWLGLGRVPTLIWLAALLLGFGLSGLALQTVAATLLAPLPGLVASGPALFAGVWFARAFAAVFARLLPGTETTAVSERHLGRTTGVVTQGTARRGRPSEVKVTDRHGNTHYIRAEPARDGEEITRGTRVLVLRHKAGTGYRIVPLGPA